MKSPNKVFIQRIQEFLTIDNPLLPVLLLIVVISSRFAVTYFNDAHHVMAPDINYYAGSFVGHDLTYGLTDQAYRLLSGLPMQLGVGYGYTFTILTAWNISLFNRLGICNLTSHLDCQFLLYRIVVVASLAGLLSLPFLFIRRSNIRVTALIFLSTFFLGVPGGMGIESGNLDIFLSVVYGTMLFLQKKSLGSRRSYFYSIFLGCISGALLQTKLFTLPIILIFLFCSRKRLLFSLSLFFTATIIAVVPGFYHVPINPLFTVQAAQTLRGVTHVSSEIVYGNNDTRAMVSGIVFSLPSFGLDQTFRELIVNILGTVLFIFILVTPLLTVVRKNYYRALQAGYRNVHSFPFFVMLNCYAVTAMILWPEISLSYRFYYLIPLIFVLLDISAQPFSKRSLAIALGALTIRSLFLWHTRVLHLFLLLFFYFFLTTSLQAWLDSIKASLHRTKQIQK